MGESKAKPPTSSRIACFSSRVQIDRLVNDWAASSADFWVKYTM